MKLSQTASTFFLSMIVHALILFGLGFIVIKTPMLEEVFDVETVLVDDEERPLDEIVKQLDEQQVAATTVNFVGGGTVRGTGGTPGAMGGAFAAVGGGSSMGAIGPGQKVQVQQSITGPGVRVSLAAQTLPSAGVLAMDLGQGQVTGEVGAPVQGYGDALDRMSQELLRLLRSEKLLVVWMFDESESMKDDQEQIKKRIRRVYEELRLVETDVRAVGSKKKLDDILLTAITSFGEMPHKQTQEPTGNPDDLMAAIEKIPIEKNGTENLFSAIIQVVKEYRPMASRAKRKLVLVVVSDESGDDGHLVEEALKEARIADAPIYILGREAVFGSLYAHVHWTQPITNRTFYLPVRRGPETPFAELLQYGGFRRRRDAQMSGFGPYEQVRLCKMTNGIFFQLPGEQEDLVDLAARQDEMLTHREYLPDLNSRGNYQEDRDKSEFRKAIWDVIVMLNPYDPNAKGLEIPDPVESYERFDTDPASYGPTVQQRLQQVKTIIAVMQQARRHLGRVRDQRDAEPSKRWRANYDLISAQLLWYQVRLFEYAIGLEQFARKGIPAKVQQNPKLNRWYIQEDPSEFIMPDALQQKLLGVTPEELQKVYDQAVAALEKVKADHPNTPWASRAQWELARKSGVRFQTYHQPPPGPPNPNAPKRPTPPPPPKL